MRFIRHTALVAGLAFAACGGDEVTGADDEVLRIRITNDRSVAVAVHIVGAPHTPQAQQTTVDFGTLQPGETSTYEAAPGVSDGDAGPDAYFYLYLDGALYAKQSGACTPVEVCTSFGIGHPYYEWTLTLTSDGGWNLLRD